MLSLDDALANVLADLRPLPPERLALPDALFRVLAEDVTSGRELPPEDNSQMDGYAVRSADVAGAGPDTPVLLRVVGRVFAGERPAVQVGANEAVRIMTGATLPPGADAVVMQ
ncbi:MAG: molybdopterin molybdenumtransferase MoeA, partial [Myxococcales bacterium]